MWPRWILLQAVVFAVRLTNILNTSQRLVNKNSLTWWLRLQNVLKMSSRRICETSWRRLGKTSWRCLEDFLKTSSKRLEDVIKMYLRDVLKTFWRRLEDVLKTCWRRLASWRCVEDVLKTSWRRMDKTNILVLTKTSWRRLLKTKTKDIFFKTSSRRLHQDEWLLGYLIFSETVCHISHFLVYFCYLWAMTHFKEFEKFLTRLFLSVVFINLDCVYM